jgi:hypothetical protein
LKKNITIDIIIAIDSIITITIAINSTITITITLKRHNKRVGDNPALIFLRKKC